MNESLGPAMRRSGRLANVVLAALGWSSIACVAPIPLEGHSCPCSAGYRCCSGRCLPGAACPAAPEKDAAPVGSPIALTPPEAAVPDAGATNADAGPPPLTWQTVQGFGIDLVATFDVRLGSDGLPFVALSRTMPGGGHARSIDVYRQLPDGSFQQLGAVLRGPPYPIQFALGLDDTPYVLDVDGVMRRFDASARAWRALPDLPDAVFDPLEVSALGMDRLGRLHAAVASNADRSFRILRFNGGGWDLLGQPDDLGAARVPPLFAFDSVGPYLAIDDVDGQHTDLFQLVGDRWTALGGGGLFAPLAGGLPAVAADGTAFLVTAESGSVDVVTIEKAHRAPWQALTGLGTVYGVTMTAPGIDVGADGRLYVAYMGNRGAGDDIVPGPMVARLDGNSWTMLPVGGLDTSVANGLLVRVGRTHDGSEPPLYIGYLRRDHLTLMRLP